MATGADFTIAEQFTPRPWTYGVRDDGSIWQSRGNPTAGAHYQSDFYGTEADARLIAAAPEMLALLVRYRNETPLGNQPHMIASEADAVIAKACGQ